jgi:hypothetical protein
MLEKMATYCHHLPGSYSHWHYDSRYMIFDVVLVIQPGLEKGYSETRCATAMLFDDLLNGNDSMDTKDHFIGLKPLQAKLNAVGNEVNEKI